MRDPAPQGGQPAHDQRRTRRMTDYLENVLSDPKPDVALLGGIVTDLAHMELALCGAIQEVLSGQPTARDYLAVAPQGLEMLLKVSRQVERMVRLAHEIQTSDAGPGGAPVRPAATGELDESQCEEIEI